MSVTQVRGSTQIIAGSIYDAQIASSAAIASSKLADGANWIKKDGTVAMTAALNMNSHLISNLSTPSADTDAATKAYVDGLVSAGLTLKSPVNYISTGDLTLSGLTTQTYGDWPSTLTAGDRILVKDNTTTTENGIYVAATGAWTRATDFNSSGNIITNSFFFVSKGTALASTGWVMSTVGPVTPGTTPIAFVQFSAAGVIVAGNYLTKTGNSLAVNLGDGLHGVTNNVTVQLDGSTLALSSSGLKLAALTSAYLLVGNSSNVATGVALSGDATISNAGAVTVASTVAKYASFIFSEAPTGTIDSSNVTFVLANVPKAGTVRVYLNGLRQQAGSGNDYTISSDTITYLTAPSTGDIMLIDYIK